MTEGAVDARFGYHRKQKRKTRIATYLVVYIIGALAAFGFIRLAHAPDWLSAVSITISLVSGAITSVVEKKLDDAKSIPLGRLATVALLGAATVVLAALTDYWQGQHADFDALAFISSSNNVGMEGAQLAVFSVEVPKYRSHLTVEFVITSSDGENCANGARLELVPGYAATRGPDMTIGAASDYTATVDVPSGVNYFTLSVAVIPQSGFDICKNDVTIKMARFHNDRGV